MATCLLSITSLTSRCSPHTRVCDIACTHPAWQCKCRWLQPIRCGVAPRHWWARGKVRLCPAVVSVSVAYSRRWKDRMVQASVADNATTTGRCTRLTSLITMVPLYPCMHATRPPLRLCEEPQQQCIVCLFPVDCTAAAATLPFRVQSAKSCFAKQLVKWTSAEFGSSLLSAMSINAMSIID